MTSATAAPTRQCPRRDIAAPGWPARDAQAVRGVEHGVFDRVQARPQDRGHLRHRIADGVRRPVDGCLLFRCEHGRRHHLIFTPFADVTLS